MANLSETTSDGRSAWYKYIENNKNWKDLNLIAEKDGMLRKRKGAKTEDIIEYSKGTAIKLTSHKETRIGRERYAQVKINRKEGLALLSTIRKPTNFTPTGYEVEVVNMINKVIAQNGNIPIDIKIKGDGTIYRNITGAIQVDTDIKRAARITSDPKADIILYADKNHLDSPTKNIYISHKKEGGPEAFQQYGGLSRKAGEEIYNHHETQKFLKAVVNNINEEDGMLKSPMYMDVKDARLKNVAIFGPDYGKRFGLQHTQIIGQGQPKLDTTRRENVWELDFSSHMALSGNLQFFTGDYTPVFGATYRSDRGFEYKHKRYDKVRVGIYPMKLVGNRRNLLEVK